MANGAKEFFLKGHKACAGCGPAIAMRHVLKPFNGEAVVCLATGCMEVVSTQYPASQWNAPLVHSVFENVPAVASGVSRALKGLGKKGRVVAIGGDGAFYDIGFGALSGAMERNEDFLTVCYDNECYANTGVQRSGATPWRALTATSPKQIGGKTEWKKNLAFIAAAHGIPYVATASIAFIPDFVKKIGKAKEIHGFRLIVVHAPCPLGWRFQNALTVEVARKAVACGLWNLFEIEEGAFRLSDASKREPELVGDYLRMQERFKHLTPEDIARIQEHVEKTRAQLEALEKSGVNLLNVL